MRNALRNHPYASTEGRVPCRSPDRRQASSGDEAVKITLNGVRFVVDIVAAQNANKKISASLVVAEIFPMGQFRPRMKEGENSDALFASIRYYTLLRLHEVVPARSYETLRLSMAAELGDKVLSKEFTERND
jgi:hypothetical protein